MENSLKCLLLKHKYKKEGKEKREIRLAEDNDIVIQKYVCVRCGKTIIDKRWTNYGGGIMSTR